MLVPLPMLLLLSVMLLCLQVLAGCRMLWCGHHAVVVLGRRMGWLLRVQRLVLALPLPLHCFCLQYRLQLLLPLLANLLQELGCVLLVVVMLLLLQRPQELLLAA